MIWAELLELTSCPAAIVGRDSKGLTNDFMRLTHFDAKGAARMVDVGHKPNTERVAVASGRVVMAPETLARCAELA